MGRTLGACLVVVTLVSTVLAKSGFGEACNQNNTHLDSDTWNLVTDCDPTTFCADNQTCANRGCRQDVYPFGYNGVPFAELPPLCPDGFFCPDEGSQCLQTIDVGGTCQKDRDDECTPPPNWRDLDGYLNTNGTVCLNYTCYWANVTVGQTCIVENTPYTGYVDTQPSYTYIISRDNCANGLYCDTTALQCFKGKLVGQECSGNKECISYNCEARGVCGRAADEPIHPATWVYALVGVGIFILVVGTMIALYFLHKRDRKENQIKLEQYYNEQIAYRKSIMSMSHAKNSLLGMPPTTTPDDARRSLDRAGTGYSSQVDLPLPPNLRRDDSGNYSDSGDSEVLLVPQNQEGQQPRWRG